MTVLSAAGRLTGDQPHTLLAIVNFANQHAEYLPTAKELAALLGINERPASARMKRLMEKCDCFILQGRSRRLDYEKLCTETESAQLLLKIYEIGSKRNNGRIGKHEVSQLMSFRTEEEVQDFIERGCNAGYLQRIPANPQAIRLGSKSVSHLEYLKLLTSTGID